MVAVITRVPSEVWLEVFNVHVWQNGDTPHRLLRVCHHWHSIALNAPSLWGNILYTNKTALAYSSDGIVAENRMRNKVVCISIRELVKAIERTKACSFELTTVLCYQAPYELLLPYHFILSPSLQLPSDQDWSALRKTGFSKRCKVLKIYHRLPELAFLSCLQDLSGLETLEVLTENPYKSQDREYEALDNVFKNIERTSLRLRRIGLSLAVDRFRMSDYPRLSSRVVSLQIEPGWYRRWGRAFEGLQTLEELEITGFLSSQDVQFSIPRGISRLRLAGILPTQIPLEIFTDLTYLRLDQCDKDRGGGYSLVLQRLTHLVLNNSWEAISSIKAPILESLVLRGVERRPSSQISMLRRTTLRPKYLDMDMVVEEENLRLILKEKWNDIDILRIVYLRDNQNYHNLLHNALIGTEMRLPVCPNLQQFYVIAPVPVSKKSIIQSEARLRRLVDARSQNALKHARYGWYQMPEKMHKITKCHSSEDWVDEALINWVVMA